MKTVQMLLALTGIALLSAGLSGCSQKKEATVQAPVEDQMEAAAPEAAAPEAAAPAMEHPDTDKPKDHPAH